MALLQRYQAKLLTELASLLGGDNETLVELRGATNLSLRLIRCTSRVMGTAVATHHSLWLSLARLSDREKAPLLGVFGKAVGTMTKKFEAEQKSRQAFQARMPRSSSSSECDDWGEAQRVPGFFFF